MQSSGSPTRTLIQGGWIVAHGPAGHELLREGDLVFEGDRVVFAGHGYSGPADARIEARDRLVMPGFIDSHVHAGHRALHRLMSDTGRPEYLGQPFYEVALRRAGSNTGDARSAMGDLALQAEYTVAELLRAGVTSFVEFGSNVRVQAALADQSERLGIRAFLGTGFESYTWTLNEATRRVRREHEAEGVRDLAAGLEFIAALAGRADGRLQGLLVPRDTDTCSRDLLERAARAAADHQLPVAIHAAYNPWEFHQILAEHGMTPIELLAECGLLGPRTLIGHGNFVAGDGAFHHSGGRDLEILAAAGATVSHCPVNLARRGRSLDHWDRYRRAGVAIALGTDTYPRDMMLQMRAASHMAKTLSRDFRAAPAPELFNAATLATARALGREDIGRLAPGAKADIVIVDLTGGDGLRAGPVRDPIRTLVECGVCDDVEQVFVDGLQRVKDRKVIGADLPALRRLAQSEAQKQWAGVADWDPLGRSADERAPFAFPVRERTGQ